MLISLCTLARMVTQMVPLATHRWAGTWQEHDNLRSRTGAPFEVMTSTLDSPLLVQVDSNGNGSLDSREIEVLLNSLAGDTLGEGRRVSKAEIRNVMEKVDSNKDRRIAFDEFIRVSARCSSGMSHTKGAD